VFALAGDLTGDRGFALVLADHPDLVTEVEVGGGNPDVDTPADLLAADWALRVRGNREQVDRLREIGDGADFYAPVSRLFREDPDRTGDDVLDALVRFVRPDDVLLDIGAGAGRYALPLARRVREVIAVEPSVAMLEALGEDAAAHEIRNIRTIAGRWPPTDPDDELTTARGDVSLIAHLGYDVEAIGPFLDALEAATRRTCVAVLMERTPAAAAAPFWPVVHGEARVELPALDELVALLRARGADPEITTLERQPRAYPTRDDLRAAVEHQLWVAPGGAKHGRFLDELDRRAIEREDGWALEPAASKLGIVAWSPSRALK
jgi:SAM-dependent methyltransferase